MIERKYRGGLLEDVYPICSSGGLKDLHLGESHILMVYGHKRWLYEFPGWVCGSRVWRLTPRDTMHDNSC